jgi:hypothetical protein
MQWELCGLPHGANEKTDTNHRDQHPVSPWEYEQLQFIRFGKSFGVVERPGVRNNQSNP